MKIVKFKDGTYGIRRGFFKYEYLSIYDARNSQVKWLSNTPIHHFCKGYLDDIKTAFEWLNDVGTVVKGVKA